METNWTLLHLANSIARLIKKKKKNTFVFKVSVKFTPMQAAVNS